MTDNEKILAVFGSITIGALFLASLSEDEDQKRPRTIRRRTRTNDLFPAREGTESLPAREEKVEKDSSPNLSASNFSINSRSSGTSLGFKFLTSKKNESSMTPLIKCDIRKYPSNYYNLSKKGQWKFRKSLTDSSMNLV